MKILVVDDEKIISSALQRILSRSGHEVQVANHGVEALKLVEDAPAAYDYCFVDLLMPEISGSTVLDAIKKKMPGANVFMMTAYGDMAVREDLLKRGALRVLAKPFDDIMKIPELLK
ncbi:MAG TPA: response regulator [Bdellovibrionota bacterium]|jgi:DNA-binding NtrC family response regulator